MNHFLTLCLVNHLRRNGVGNGAVPTSLNFLNRGAHANAVNFTVGSQRTHNNGDVVFAALRVDNVGKQKCFSLSLIHAAHKLPPNQRMQFGIFVDRSIDHLQQATLFQGF